MPQALAGVRILDFSWFGAGPMGTKVLADHGAEVIRVESRARLDGLRQEPPFREGQSGINQSGYFNNRNTSKLSVALDMRQTGARELALRLVALSDVVVDNFNPGVLARWGLDEAALRAARPGLIQLQMPMMGLDGPHSHWIGFGETLTALAGFNELSGDPAREPAGIGTNYPDYSSNPYHAMFAVLAALHYRHRTGEGQRIELAQYESTLNILGTALLDATVNGRNATRQANRSDRAAPHGVYPCEGDDRWLAIACDDDDQWARLAAMMEYPAWTAEARFATLSERIANGAELDGLIAEWTREHRAEELMWRLQREGVPAGVVQTARDVLENDAQLRFREHFWQLEHPETGTAHYDGPPVRLALTPGALHRPAPCLGEHTESVMRELLGLSDAEMRGYEAEGVFS